MGIQSNLNNKLILGEMYHVFLLRSFGLLNIPLQSYVLMSFIDSTRVMSFFIIMGILGISILIEGGAGSILTYETSRLIAAGRRVDHLFSFLWRRFLHRGFYYLILAALGYEVISRFYFPDIEYFRVQFYFSLLLTFGHLLLYVPICILEGRGYVKHVTQCKAVGNIAGGAMFAASVLLTESIAYFWVYPLAMVLAYAITLFTLRGSLGFQSVPHHRSASSSRIRRNLKVASSVWFVSYFLDKGFPLGLPLVLSDESAAALILSINLMNAFVSFLCIGAGIVGPRIAELLASNRAELRHIFLSHLGVIYLITFMLFIFHNPALAALGALFPVEKLIPYPNLIWFCATFVYIPAAHYFTALLKATGLEPFFYFNIFVAFITVSSFFVALGAGVDFINSFIFLRLLLVLPVFFGFIFFYYRSEISDALSVR